MGRRVWCSLVAACWTALAIGCGEPVPQSSSAATDQSVAAEQSRPGDEAGTAAQASSQGQDERAAQSRGERTARAEPRGAERPKPLLIKESQNAGAAPDGGSAAEVSIDLDRPTARNPVTAGAALTPSNVQPGGTVTLVVQAKTAPTWHIYPVDLKGDIGIPTGLKLNLPDGVEPAGDWAVPEAVPHVTGAEEYLVYEGEMTFRRTLRVGADASPGPLEVTCDFRYQACDPTSCLPPRTVTLQATAEVVASP